MPKFNPSQFLLTLSWNYETENLPLLNVLYSITELSISCFLSTFSSSTFAKRKQFKLNLLNHHFSIFFKRKRNFLLFFIAIQNSQILIISYQFSLFSFSYQINILVPINLKFFQSFKMFHKRIFQNWRRKNRMSMESTILTKPECLVYRLPPRNSVRGYRAADWGLDKPAWTGRMRVTARDEKVSIKVLSSLPLYPLVN